MMESASKRPVIRPWGILILIVLCQFLSISVWFAGNAVVPGLAEVLALRPEDLGHITSAVQFGFIAGTLVYALFNIPDRMSPSLVFLISAGLSSLFNLAAVFPGLDFGNLIFFRMGTGFFLAGVYPVGMKIAADHFETRLGEALGFLVGALVLGTALPHAIAGIVSNLSWKIIMIITSGLSLAGGVLIWWLVPDGPYRKPGQKLDFSAMTRVFRSGPFRSAAFGYFGHMWELYTFWAFVPIILKSYSDGHSGLKLNISFWAFIIIASGGLGCFLAGRFSQNQGTARIAALALAFSGICCCLSPVFLTQGSPALLILFMLFWGMMVVADSPMFSSLVASHAPAETKGTALTIVNCIGFLITIFSLELISYLQLRLSFNYLFLFLVPGPAFGLWSLLKRE